MDDSASCKTGVAKSELLTVVCPNNGLTSRLWSFFLSGHMVDFSFCWGCQTVRAHRLVLEAYFSPESLYQYAGNLAVADEKCDQNGELHSVMEFLYRGQITVPRARLNGLCQIAKELDLKVLVQAIDTVSMVEEYEGLAEVAGGESGGRSSKIILEELSQSENISDGIHLDMDVIEVMAQEEEESAKQLEHVISALNPSSDYRVDKTDDKEEKDKDWEPSESDDSSGSDRLTSMQSLNEAKSLVNMVRCGKTKARNVSSNRIVVKSQTAAKAMVRGPTIANHVGKPIPATTVKLPTVTKAGVRCPTIANHVGKPISATTVKLPTVTKAGVRCPTIANLVAKPISATTVKSPTMKSPTVTKAMVRGPAIGNHVAQPILAAARIMLARRADQSTGTKPLKCEFCRYATASQVNLDKHTAVVHPVNTILYKCSQCKYESTGKLRYKYHIYTVHGILANGKTVGKNFKCAECSFAAVNGSQLRNHMLGKHATEKRFKCEHCPYACRRRGCLNAHVRTVHQGQQRFICETCGLRTNSQGGLNRHTRRHTGEKPYSCEICGARFADSSSLSYHAMIHRNERPFVCHVCGRAFSRRSNLKVHVKNVHKTMPEAY